MGPIVKGDEMTTKQAVLLLPVIALGVMTGALLAEGFLLVPYRRALPPQDFLAWYRQHALLLQNFFGPLEVGATVVSIAAAGVSWFGRDPARQWLTCSAVLGVAVLAVFPLYFQDANTSFRTGTIALAAVSEELNRWSNWHGARTALAFAAFVAAAVAGTKSRAGRAA